ncbi:MAG: prephenate dehydrogenase/arogenate dehydrogenase family protein [Chloroflexota bacterium]
MSVQITIIGLGQIGTSIGLSLSKYPDRFKRIGYDKALEIQNKAKGMGAFDAVKFNLSAAIENADLVLVCIPLDQVESTFESISPLLKDNAVVIDFSPVKSTAYTWFKKYSAPGKYFIGLVSSINAAYLDQPGSGIDAASEFLFEKTTIGVTVPSGTPTQVIKLAVDLIEMIGAQAIFLDMQEADGMEMTAHIIPQVISAALLNATVGLPGWTETRRFAGRTFFQTTAALGSDTIRAIQTALLNNPVSAVNALNNMIGALTHIRNAIDTKNDADLQKRLELAFSDRETWLNERYKAKWNDFLPKQDAPKSGEMLKHILLGGFKKEKKK